MADVDKTGPTVPVMVRDGVPVCWCCEAPMVQVAEPDEGCPGGIWQCPIAAEAMAEMLEGLRRSMAFGVERTPWPDMTSGV